MRLSAQDTVEAACALHNRLSRFTDQRHSSHLISSSDIPLRHPPQSSDIEICKPVPDSRDYQLIGHVSQNLRGLLTSFCHPSRLIHAARENPLYPPGSPFPHITYTSSCKKRLDRLAPLKPSHCLRLHSPSKPAAVLGY